MPGATLHGPWHAVDSVDYTVNLRRFNLDSILVEAARAAGADVREGLVVDGLLRTGDQVAGITGYQRRTRNRFEQRASLVVGADGQRSILAKLVQAESYNAVPSLSVTYYSYFSDFPRDPDTDEMHTCPPREYLFSPTDDGLTVVNLVLSNEIAREFGRDAKENFYRAFDLEPMLGERLRAARLVDHIRGVREQPNFYRRSNGPGWALVGDAAYTKDPIRAQGITDAFLDAETLAAAIDDGFSGRRPMNSALGEAEKARRDRTAFPYDLCLRSARFEFPPGMRELLKAAEQNPTAIAEMRGLISGSVRPEVFFDPQHLEQLMGAGAVAVGLGR